MIKKSDCINKTGFVLKKYAAFLCEHRRCERRKFEQLAYILLQNAMKMYSRENGFALTFNVTKRRKKRKCWMRSSPEPFARSKVKFHKYIISSKKSRSRVLDIEGKSTVYRSTFNSSSKPHARQCRSVRKLASWRILCERRRHERSNWSDCFAIFLEIAMKNAPKGSSRHFSSRDL